MRGKHEIKAAVIRGRIYIYIYTHSWNGVGENSRRDKKGEGKKKREIESFSSLFPPPFSLLD